MFCRQLIVSSVHAEKGERTLHRSEGHDDTCHSPQTHRTLQMTLQVHISWLGGLLLKAATYTVGGLKTGVKLEFITQSPQKLLAVEGRLSDFVPVISAHTVINIPCHLMKTARPFQSPENSKISFSSAKYPLMHCLCTQSSKVGRILSCFCCV
ncbi:Hypothetical predicted protein [Podarcis lilfordi]|uniref:Uncharacterized protein n=1 Tax=Podarcis lilfordi TaxID=74358 RepID=A0AA35JW05_9SAUR|nr:Hypothetical predicted protein [Podarcis lilfordi]